MKRHRAVLNADVVDGFIVVYTQASVETMEQALSTVHQLVRFSHCSRHATVLVRDAQKHYEAYQFSGTGKLTEHVSLAGNVLESAVNELRDRLSDRR